MIKQCLVDKQLQADAALKSSQEQLKWHQCAICLCLPRKYIQQM